MERILSLPNTKSYDMSFDMRKHWDAIVVGAGMGGFTAAAHLVKAGWTVTMDRKMN